VRSVLLGEVDRPIHDDAGNADFEQALHQDGERIVTPDRAVIGTRLWVVAC